MGQTVPVTEPVLLPDTETAPVTDVPLRGILAFTTTEAPLTGRPCLE